MIFYIIYMKIEVDNRGKNESYTLIDSWNDVTVENYARLVKYNELNGSQKSLHTIGLMTDIPKMLIKQMDVVSLAGILSTIASLQAKDEDVYALTFKHEGKEYGMIPDLSKITLGEYADLETFINRGAIENLSSIAAILFRPITQWIDSTYIIEAYNLDSMKEREIAFKQLSASQVQSALVFFWSLGSGLLSSLGLSSEMLLQTMKEK